MNAGLIIYGFALGSGPAIAFCVSREAALSGAQTHRAELLADGYGSTGDHLADLPPTPIYKITVRPFDVTMALDLLNNPDAHVARMLQSVETIALVPNPEMASRFDASVARPPVHAFRRSEA